MYKNKEVEKSVEKEQKYILSKVDHTILKATTTWDDIVLVIAQASKNECASICIPPSYVALANSYMENNGIRFLPICTVIGFPLGNTSTKVKCKETKQAIKDGAKEIDMVINIGWLKNGFYQQVEEEIAKIAKICHNRTSNITLKVIIETCLLTKEEIEIMCGIVARAGADYIKTSTGFSTGGATVEDIILMRTTLDKDYAKMNEFYKAKFPYRSYVKIKASGGIKTFEDAQAMLDACADRIGASGLAK